VTASGSEREASRWARVLAVLAITGLAFGLRWRAIERLPIDYEEPWCFAAAEQLSLVLRSGEWGRLTETNPTPEHPQLAKLVLAAAMLPAPESAPSPTRGSVFYGRPGLPEKQLVAARTGSGVLGALEVLLLAWIHPLAGLLLAIHTYTVKFTSQAQLEALPAFTSLATVVTYLRFKRTGRRGWLIGSAALLGLTAAAKYVYAIVGLVILIDWALELRATRAGRLSRLRLIALWGCGSLFVFFAATPYFWPDPLSRLEASVSYLTAYSTENSEVRQAAFPFWQPLAWLTTYIPNDAPALEPYLIRIDPLISLLALVGLVGLWRKERIWVLWLGVGLVFLVLWNTKWPYYVLILTAPLCRAAAEGTRQLLAWPLGALERRRGGA
jgi:4-amino-4-deoxy-L-arabinose transferase-like glycosyltransferase